MKFQSNAIFNGTITANSVADAGTNTDKFLVLNSSGIVTYRTAAELYADLNIANLPAGSTSTVKHLVKAGVAVTKGQAVYVTSADGTNMIIGKASNASEATSSKTMGLIESTLAINGQGNVITEGLLAGLDTTGATNPGDPVWLGVDGNLIYGLANKPYAPAHLVFIGIVTRINANNGEIFVKVQNGFELKEIHDVDLITTTPVNGHILGYNGTLWVNKTIAGWLGFTPVTSARTLTINGVSYDLSADRSWTIEGGGGGTSASTRTVQKYTADGTTATYTVTGGYTIGMVDVYVNGIKLDNASGVEFTATNGTTVVLTNTPASGDIVEVYKYGSQFIANNALRQVTAFTATAGQTEFTVSYSVGYVDVFYNGSKLAASEYTATNGTSITLGTACVVNDIVEVVAYSYTVGAFTGVGGSGTANYISKFTASGTIGNSSIFDNGTSVGVGTATPFGTFNVVAGTNKSLIIQDSGIADTIEIASYSTSGGTRAIAMNGSVLTFGTGTAGGGSATPRLTINATGNLGIGTNSPVGKLDINAGGNTNIVISNDSVDTGYNIISLNGTRTKGSYAGIAGGGTGDNNLYLNSGSNIVFQTGASYTARMAITSSGNVGIGTSNPSALLTLLKDSNIGINTSDGSDNGYLALCGAGGDGSARGGHIYLSGNERGADAGTAIISAGNVSDAFIGFRTGAGTERMRITTGGAILMGLTTNPASARLALDAIGMAVYDGGNYRQCYMNGNTMAWFNGSNQGTLSSAGVWTDASDISIKKDIKDIEYGLNEVLQLKPRWYRMKNDDLEQVGFIAQEVEEVIKELVTTDNKDMKGLSYGQLTAVLVKAIQEQQAQIDDLKKLIN